MLFLAFLKKHAIISSIIIRFRSLLRGLAGTDPYDPEFFMGNQYRPFFSESRSLVLFGSRFAWEVNPHVSSFMDAKGGVLHSLQGHFGFDLQLRG